MYQLSRILWPLKKRTIQCQKKSTPSLCWNIGVTLFRSCVKVTAEKGWEWWWYPAGKVGFESHMGLGSWFRIAIIRWPLGFVCFECRDSSQVRIISVYWFHHIMGFPGFTLLSSYLKNSRTNISFLIFLSYQWYINEVFDRYDKI